MLDMITPNFSRAEMSCRCGCGLDHMDEQFMKMLQQLRNQLGPLPITSGVRCEKYNHESGGYPKSAHLQSKGADIRIFGPRALQLVEEARRIERLSEEKPNHRSWKIQNPASSFHAWELCGDEERRDSVFAN